MTTIALNQDEQSSLRRIQSALQRWCATNPVPLGVCQVAAGAALIALGVKTGAIEIGSALLATHVPLINGGAATGALGGGAAGGWAGSVLGGIGVAAAGTAIGIPAALVAGGAACVFSLAGYAVGDMAHNILFPGIDPSAVVVPGSLLVIGTYLVLKGSTDVLRALGMPALLKSGISIAKNSILKLSPLSDEILVLSKAELAGFAAEWSTAPRSPSEVLTASTAVAACSAGGIAAGSAAAASSVTLLGSSSLGSLALSAGLMSAPLWPVVAGAVVAGGLGFTVYKACRYVAKKKSR